MRDWIRGLQHATPEPQVFTPYAPACTLDRKEGGNLQNMYSSLVLGKASFLILVCEIYLLSLHKRMRKIFIVELHLLNM